MTYYDNNAEQFYNDTVDLDLSALHSRFLNGLSPGAHLLDAGCGSGRDALAFLQAGFTVSAFDASPMLAALASKHTGLQVANKCFEDVAEVEAYDAIWCCASLLHVPANDMVPTLRKLWTALKSKPNNAPRSSLYMSFKHGNTERVSAGRHFTDATPSLVRHWLSFLPDCFHADIWVTQDVRSIDQQWVNVIAFKG